MAEAPDPLVAADVDLTDFGFMPLDVRRLRDSKIAANASGDEFRAAVLLWCAAWHQKPAASLPDDDVELSQLAGYGRVVREWRKVRDGALHGWVKCSDGRLYHPVIAEKANEAWGQRISYQGFVETQRHKGRLGAAKRWGKPKDKSANGHGHANQWPPLSESDGLKGEGEGKENAAAIAPASTDSEKDLYDRGKAILGKSAGGLIRQLLAANSGVIAKARAVLETASTKSDPREYTMGAIRRALERPEEPRMRVSM